MKFTELGVLGLTLLECDKKGCIKPTTRNWQKLKANRRLLKKYNAKIWF